MCVRAPAERQTQIAVACLVPVPRAPPKPQARVELQARADAHLRTRCSCISILEPLLPRASEVSRRAHASQLLLLLRSFTQAWGFAFRDAPPISPLPAIYVTHSCSAAGSLDQVRADPGEDGQRSESDSDATGIIDRLWPRTARLHPVRRRTRRASLRWGI